MSGRLSQIGVSKGFKSNSWMSAEELKIYVELT